MTPIKATLRSPKRSAGIAVEEAIRLYQNARATARIRETKSRERAARKIRKAYRKAQQRAHRAVEDQVRSNLKSFFGELSELQLKYEASLEGRVTTLALQLAESLIQSELITNESGIKERYDQLLQSLHGSTPETLLCHPVMIEAARNVSPLPVEASETLAPGDIAIRTGNGNVQSDVTQHFDNLKAFIKNSVE